MFQTKVVEKIKTHFASNNLFPKIVKFEIIWKNNVESDRPQMTTWLITCWITQLTLSHSLTHSELDYVILTAFPLQQWLHEHASVLRLYVHACLTITEMKSVYCEV
jgi:hypothetical protein